MPAAGKSEKFSLEIRQLMRLARVGLLGRISNFAEAAAMRVTLSPSGLTATMPETIPVSS